MTIICKRCGWEWISRKVKPVCCPRCKSYEYDKPKKEEMKTSKTLRDLINEHGANGVIRIDAGNGSAGPMWADWDDDIDSEYGDIVMHEVDKNYNAYTDGDDNHTSSFLQVAHYVVPDYTTDDTMYASDWIEDDDRNAPYRATNPYRYRLIF